MQALQGVAANEFLAAGQEMLVKYEIYVGAAWINLNSLANKDRIQRVGLSLGGASMTPNPVEATWSATVKNQDSIFHPQHPTSIYNGYLETERLTRISVGATYDGVDHYWQRMIGYMNVPKFSAPGYEVAISGGDYMKRLRETEIRSGVDDNYWGASENFNSIPSDGLSGAELYAQADCLRVALPAVDNVGAWVANNCNHDSVVSAGAPSAFVMEVTNTEFENSYISNANIHNGVNGTGYIITFKYKFVSGPSAYPMGVGIYQGATNIGNLGSLNSLTWETVCLFVTAVANAAIIMELEFGDIGQKFEIDDLSVYEYVPYWKQYYPITDANAKGPYYVTYDGDPVWQGEVDEGWFYTEDAEAGPDPPSHPARIVYFDPNKTIVSGKTVRVYYFLEEAPEDVVADILVKAGIAEVLDFDATGITIDRVWFDAGTTCLDAIKKLCERVNYRFYFAYDGIPVFKPQPGPAVADFTFTDPKQLTSITTYQDRNEIRNRIVIKGDKRAEPVNKDDTIPSHWEGELSDATSITAYGERTLSINNHLFQDQDSITHAVTGMCKILLDEYKAPKWYATLKLDFNPIPLEIGDNIQWEERLSPVLDITQEGIIRDIKINNFKTTYKCVLK